MENAVGWTLWIALTPLSALVASRLLPSFRPPKHRPMLFVVGFIFFAAFGAGAVLVAQKFVHSGAFHVASRKLGDFNYLEAHQPLQYWAAIAMLYGMGVCLVGCGIAIACLCFRKPKVLA